MYHILIVDDESRIRTIIRKYAEFDGHTVTEAGDGMEAVMLCRKQTFDLVIMDIMMPELDGFSACREIRKITDTPIIMLSARGEEYDKINGFELGIDDYVVKPFSPKELMLRVEAVMKRVSRAASPAASQTPNRIVELDGGGLRADITARIVYVNGERVEMSPKEYDLFFYMLANRNVALSRERLISEVWGYDFFGDARTLDICFNYFPERESTVGSAYGAGANASAVTDCRVFGNAIFGGSQKRQGAGLYGGGATNSVIYENYCTSSGSGVAMNGGRAYGCVFSNNQSRTSNGDSMQVRQPGGPIVNCTFIGQSLECSTRVSVENCRFVGYKNDWKIPAGHNVASMDEDIVSSTPMSYYMFSGNIHLRNCLIEDNVMKYICEASEKHLQTFENCTFANNKVDAMFYKYKSDSFETNAAYVVNSIFTENYKKEGTERSDLSFKTGSNVALEKCIVGTSRSSAALYSETATITNDNVHFNFVCFDFFEIL